MFGLAVAVELIDAFPVILHVGIKVDSFVVAGPQPGGVAAALLNRDIGVQSAVLVYVAEVGAQIVDTLNPLSSDSG